MNAPADDPRDPRFKSFRAASLGIYLVVTIFFSCLIIYSVYRSVLKMTPERPPAGEVRSEEDCLRDARGLFLELEAERKAQAEQADVKHSDQQFLKFRVAWLTRKLALESACELESRERTREAFESLDRMLDLYTTATVQFSSGVGPTVDKFKKQLEP